MGLNLVFDSTYDLCKGNNEIQELFVNLDLCKDDAFHKETIDRYISKFLEENVENTTIVNILLEFPVWYTARRTIKKYLCDRYSKILMRETNIFENLIIQAINKFMEDMTEGKDFKTKQCLRILNFIYTYIQVFKTEFQYDFIIENVFPWYLKLKINLAYHLPKFNSNYSDDISTILSYTLQHQLIIFTKSKSPLLGKKSVNLSKVVHGVLDKPLLKFETVAKGTLLLAHVLKHLPLEECSQIVNKHLPMLDFLHGNIVLTENTEETTLQNIFLSDEMKLVLYCAILNSIDDGKILHNHYNLYLNMIQFGSLMTGYPEKIMLISRTLFSVSGHFQNVELFEKIFQNLLSFTWAHLEHFVESVCHSTKDLLQQIVHHAVNFHNKGHLEFLEILLKEVQLMPINSSVRLIAYRYFCEAQAQFEIDSLPNVQKYLLIALSDKGLSQQAGDLYTRLMEKKSNKCDVETFFQSWIHPVMSILEKVDTDNATIIQKVITSGFQYKPEIFKYSFSSNSLNTNSQCITFLKCIHSSRIKGINLSLEFNSKDDSSYWRGLIKKHILEALMTHQEDEIRIMALQVVVECQRSTEEILDWEMSFLISFITYNISSQVPSTTKKIGSLYKKLFIRLEASKNCIWKKITTYHDSNIKDLKKHHDSYSAFIMNLIKLFLNNLAPDSNFPRRTLSLELLLILNKIASSEEWGVCFTSIEATNLTNIVLFDNYESNKALAVLILKTLPPELIGFQNESMTLSNIDTYLTWACDIKPNFTSSASYMIQVCLFSPHYPKKSGDTRYDTLIILTDKLEDLFQTSRGDIVSASQNSPLHGLVLCINSLLQGRDLNQNNVLYSCLSNRLITLCFEIKDYISPIVCNPSPEGHIPEYDVTICENDYTSKAQMVLVYAWRTMKEIMLLLAELVKQTVTLESSVMLVADDNLIKIGNFFIDVFIQTKHRGVFEQAGVAFSIICKQFWRSNNKSVSGKPNEWLKLAVALCTARSNDIRLCSTRRSAGLPFLILSIISTGLDSHSTNFHKTVEQLVEVASDTNPEMDEFRTHSLNVLRYIFINSKLGDFVPIFVDGAVIASLQGFESKVWGVRNSSTLLFSALMTRMFGVQRSQDSDNVAPKNRLTLATFYLRYPKLLDFLLETLRKECDKHDRQMLHPILMILARLYPSHTDTVNEKVRSYYKYMETCISNPVYRTRDLAARASISLIGMEQSSDPFEKFFRKISSAVSKEVEYHKTLLQILHLLKTSHKLNDDIDVSSYFKGTLHFLNKRHNSDVTVSLYMEVMGLILMRFHSFNDLDTLKMFFVLICNQKRQILSTSKNDFDWNRFKLILIILMGKFQQNSKTFEIIAREFTVALSSSNSKLKIACLHFLNGLYQSCDIREKHPLYMGELEMSADIKEIIDYLGTSRHKLILLNLHPFMKVIMNEKLIQLHTFCKNEQGKKIWMYSEENILILLLQNYFSCNFKTDCCQEGIEFFLEFCQVHNEEIVSGGLSCITSFLTTRSDIQLKNVNLDRFFQALVISASPSSSDYLRLTVAQSLVVLNNFFCGKSSILSIENLIKVFDIVMVLLEDEEIEVRKTISGFEIISNEIIPDLSFPITSEKSRHVLLENIPKVLPKNEAILFLISWGCRQLTGSSKDVSEIYERCELNQFAENIPITYTAGKVLRDLTIAEKSQINFKNVADDMIKSLTNGCTPIICDETKKCLIIGLQTISKHLEIRPLDQDFCDLMKTVGVDFYTVNLLLKIVFCS